MKWFGSNGMPVCRRHCCLQGVVDRFYSVWLKRKLKVNAGKNKMMFFERKEI